MKNCPICYIIAAMNPGNNMTYNKEDGDIVIAADAGLKFADKLGLTPDIAVGDFDSLGYTPNKIPHIVYPKEKDDTDTMIAVKYGLSKGYKRFVIVGALGGRLDHTIANIQTLSYLAYNNAVGLIHDEYCSIIVIENAEIDFTSDFSGNISVFSLTDKSEISISGLKYNLSRDILKSDFPLGVSNEFIGQNASVNVYSGKIMIICGQRMTFDNIALIKII